MAIYRLHLSVFAQYPKNKYIENKFELECTVDGVPSQIPTLKFLIHPAPPSPAPGLWPEQQSQNSVQYVYNISFVRTHTEIGIKILELTW